MAKDRLRREAVEAASSILSDLEMSNGYLLDIAAEVDAAIDKAVEGTAFWRDDARSHQRQAVRDLECAKNLLEEKEEHINSLDRLLTDGTRRLDSSENNRLEVERALKEAVKKRDYYKGVLDFNRTKYERLHELLDKRDAMILEQSNECSGLISTKRGIEGLVEEILNKHEIQRTSTCAEDIELIGKTMDERAELLGATKETLRLSRYHHAKTSEALGERDRELQEQKEAYDSAVAPSGELPDPSGLTLRKIPEELQYSDDGIADVRKLVDEILIETLDTHHWSSDGKTVGKIADKHFESKFGRPVLSKSGDDRLLTEPKPEPSEFEDRY